VPGNLIEAMIDLGRHETDTRIRPIRAPRAPLGAMPKEIRHLPVATHQLNDGEWAVGKTLGDINLRATTGASVIAIQSHGQYVTTPTSDQALAAGDVLFLLGDESDVLLARQRLSAG
jgi:K+/H+ antiporter YhaU regulatory subunit KhtT